MTTPFPFPARYTFTGTRLEGGQGFVYLCEDALLSRRVAIKVMKLTTETDELRKEMAALKDIRSKHIAQIYDLLIDTQTGMLGLVQEYVPGKALETWTSTAHDMHEALGILYQLSCGITDIHANNKIHRDIKTNNARFDAESVLKILDFGLAQPASPPPSTVYARGTLYYRAPEMYAPPPITLTTAVDVYAYGITSAIVLNDGSLPKILAVAPPQKTGFSFASLLGLAVPEVTAVLDRTLEIEPALRPTMAEIKTILETRLLYGQHRALICWKGQTRVLAEAGKAINLKIGNDSIAISYDGLTFKIAGVTGEVFVNNIPAVQGDTMPGSCVITIGGPVLGWSRTFVTVDMSHPGVEP